VGDPHVRFVRIKHKTRRMPSRPILQACRNTVAPSSSVCSLNSMPAGARASSRASLALRSLSGLGLRIGAPRWPCGAMQGVEDGNTVVPDHHGLAVWSERLGAQLGGCRGDGGIAVGPFITAAGEHSWRPRGSTDRCRFARGFAGRREARCRVGAVSAALAMLTFEGLLNHQGEYLTWLIAAPTARLS
jgi:hypothetical protein